MFYPSYPKEITFYLRENGFRFELLVLCGGDGTLNEAINGLMNLIYKPKLLYIPSGTVNDVSKALNLNKIDLKKCSNFKKIDICKINNEYFVYAVGCGKFSSASYDTHFYFLKRMFRKFYYYFKAFCDSFKVYDLNMTINYEGMVVSKKCFLFLGLNLDHVAGFKVSGRSKYNDGKIKLYFFKGKFSIFKLLCFFFLPVKYFVDVIEGSEFKITFDQKMIFNLDGEKGMENREIKITVIKEAITIYVGIKANTKFEN